MTDRIPLDDGIDPGDVPDGTYAIQVEGGAIVGLTAADGNDGRELLTSSVNGVPDLVWDDNDNLVYAEGPTA